MPISARLTSAQVPFLCISAKVPSTLVLIPTMQPAMISRFSGQINDLEQHRKGRGCRTFVIPLSLLRTASGGTSTHPVSLPCFQLKIAELIQPDRPGLCDEKSADCCYSLKPDARRMGLVLTIENPEFRRLVSLRPGSSQDVIRLSPAF